MPSADPGNSMDLAELHRAVFTSSKQSSCVCVCLFGVFLQRAHEGGSKSDTGTALNIEQWSIKKKLPVQTKCLTSEVLPFWAEAQQEMAQNRMADVARQTHARCFLMVTHRWYLTELGFSASHFTPPYLAVCAQLQTIICIISS